MSKRFIDYYLDAVTKKEGSGGGGSATLIDKNINANGTYNASSDSADGYKKVVVNVPTPTPDLQFKSELYRANGLYSVSPDSGYDGLSSVDVEVNLPIQSSKPQTITQNGTVTVSPDSGYDAMEEAEITVNVPTGGNVQTYKQATFSQNGYFQVTPDSGYDSIATVGVAVEVPTGGGDGDVLTGTVTMTDGENTLPITIPSGKTIKEATMYLTNFSDLANIPYRRAYVFDSFVVTPEGGYLIYGYRNYTSDTLPISNSQVAHTDTIPSLSTMSPLGIDTATGTIHYRGKSADAGYSFISGYSYTYVVVLE